jgi:ABC-type nitrate/sulfonate/bicarbonate transport system permease component
VPAWVPPTIAIVGIVVCWEVVGRTVAADSVVLPAPSRIVAQVQADGLDFYWRNATSTLSAAAKGWLVGNGLAIALATVAILIPLVERPLLQLGLTSYCLPLLAIATILRVVYDGDTPKVVLAAMQVFFVTLVGALVGLRNVDRASLDVVHAYGGGSLHKLAKVRFRACQPTLFAALRIAAPAAVIGAILGEYLGAERGLGAAMITSQQGLDVERTWALCILTTAFAGLGYAMTSVVGRALTPWAPRSTR